MVKCVKLRNPLFCDASFFCPRRKHRHLHNPELFVTFALRTEYRQLQAHFLSNHQAKINLVSVYRVSQTTINARGYWKQKCENIR